MKFNPFPVTCVAVGVTLLLAFLYGLAVSPTGEPNTGSFVLLAFAITMFVIPWAKKFTLFKVFEWERHDDDAKHTPGE